MNSPRPAALSLENCDREPIHIPGLVQPHGALLAFDLDGRLTHHSANAPAMLGLDLRLGDALQFGSGKTGEALRHALQEVRDGFTTSTSTDEMLGGRQFDVVLNGSGATVLCEFEPRPPGQEDVSGFAHLAHQAMQTLKHQRTTERLLNAAVTAVRQITGFDRVMAYRFRHDDSGEVVAEARAEFLDAYLGRRYPASDIPSQARRLYALNTLRLIADTAYHAVGLVADPAQAEPLDLSHSILRSVSPIHVEYLENMGVGASMSVSIVISGKLWGMLACHHMAARRVAFPTRMAVDVMAQLIASMIQSIEAHEREKRVSESAALRTELGHMVSRGSEVPETIQFESARLVDALRCEQVVVLKGGQLRFSGGLNPDWAVQLAAQLKSVAEPVVQICEAANLPAFADSVPESARFCGVLGLRFDNAQQGWLVALRREQIQTIRWGGKPDKEIAHGPFGPRLTPRGSFDEWRELVRGTATPWDAVDLEIATQLLDSLSRAHADRVVETDLLRSQLWAILGHDLRNPLQSISMASTAIQRGMGSDRLNTVVRNSAERMKQLVGNVLDIARFQNGFALTLEYAEADMADLVRQLVDESHVAHPTSRFEVAMPPGLIAQVDKSRFSQVIANLISNARHHGDGSATIRGAPDGTDLVVSVENQGAPIPDEVAAHLFDPFKRLSLSNQRNPTGMGLGLYIAHQVVTAHGGTLSYLPGSGTVVFEVRVPRLQPDAPQRPVS